MSQAAGHDRSSWKSRISTVTPCFSALWQKGMTKRFKTTGQHSVISIQVTQMQPGNDRSLKLETSKCKNSTSWHQPVVCFTARPDPRGGDNIDFWPNHACEASVKMQNQAHAANKSRPSSSQLFSMSPLGLFPRRRSSRMCQSTLGLDPDVVGRASSGHWFVLKE